MKKQTAKLNVIVVSFAALFVVVATLVTLYSTGITLEIAGMRLGSDEGGGYQNITFTDAVMACNEATEDRYGARIRNIEVDNHSSRYDGDAYLYKVFLKMDMYDKKAVNTQLHYINCFVRATNGSIRRYDVFEDAGKKDKGIDTYGTNLFGMPKKG